MGSNRDKRSSSMDCGENSCEVGAHRLSSMDDAYLHSKEDFYKQLLELKRRNQRRLRHLESQFKRRHSDAFREGYINGDCCCCSSQPGPSVLEQPKTQEPKTHKRRTQSAPALQKKLQKTVIEPFSMTRREEQKSKERLLLQESMTKKDEEDKKEEDEIINRNFKASSVPKHISKPLFRNMVLKHPQRYGGTKYLHLGTRLNKSQSCSDLSHFRAKPFPNHIFTDYAYEKMKEDDEYRRVRRETRQKALLSEASYPPRMKTDLEGYKGKLRKSNAREPTKRVRMRALRSHIVPDFDHLYEQFQNSLELKKMTGRSATHFEPFSFDGKYASKSASSKVEPKGMTVRPCRPAPVTFDIKPQGKTTNTARLRELANRSRIESMEYDSKRRQMEKEQLYSRQKEFRKNPDWYGRLNDQPNTKEDIRIRMLQRMEDERERMVAYKMELKRIYAKVQSRPPLFIRESQQSGTHKVEKMYSNALSREGLSEREILQFLSGKGRSVSVQDNLHCMLNLTYSKSSVSSSIDDDDSSMEEPYGRDMCRDHREFCSIKSQEL